VDNIIIIGAREGNLKDISLEIPRNKLVVFTGLSGSRKSTLAMDTIYMECQRQYLEAMGYQGIHKPKIDCIRNASPSIMITQNEYSKNPRSSVGTVTNIYTDLRMIYEKLSKRICPDCNGERLNKLSRSVTVNDTRLPELVTLSLDELYHWLINLEDSLSGADKLLVLPYLIDESITGLHPIDVENFLVLINRIVDSGNTVIVIEHNVQIIKSSDWVVDLGPEGGVNGGRVIAEGTPDDIRRNKNSVTGKYI